jgi:large subunit ribosomal protein L29
MRASEVRELSRDELTQKILDLRQELFNLRFQAATGRIEKPARLRAIRRDIARIKTILGEKS